MFRTREKPRADEGKPRGSRRTSALLKRKEEKKISNVTNIHVREIYILSGQPESI